MDVNHAARCLEKLGNPTRLEIVRLLVRAGSEGLPVGEVQRHLGIPASTLSHHILGLVSVGLVRQQREGRVLRCTPDYELLDGLVAMLTEECCSGVAEPTEARDAG
ncbi:MAG: ArsR/SmtB family transcription factor [Alphaproteobacteria bacterium]